MLLYHVYLLFVQRLYDYLDTFRRTCQEISWYEHNGEEKCEIALF